jgi:hypothetical protein
MRILTVILLLILTTAVFIYTPGCTDTEDQVQTQPAAVTLPMIRGIDLDSLQRDVDVYYSPGYSERAVELLAMIEEAVAFFEDSLALRTEVTLVVLSPDHWQQLTPLPYGVPFASPEARTIILPAADGRITEIFKSLCIFFISAIVGTFASIDVNAQSDRLSETEEQK